MSRICAEQPVEVEEKGMPLEVMWLVEWTKELPKQVSLGA